MVYTLVWQVSRVRMLLEFVRDRGAVKGGPLVAFELGNELFQPPHLSPATAAKDIALFAALVAEVWNATTAAHPLPIYAPGTNDCSHSNDSEVFAAADGVIHGFSFHNYPKSGVNMTQVLNSSWLRSNDDMMRGGVFCLETWESDGYKERGLAMVSEAHIITVIAPLFSKNLDLRWVVYPAPSSAGCKVRLESRIEKD